MRRLFGFLALLVSLFAPRAARAQEPAYFVTYDHYLEERGNLEVAVASTSGFPREGKSRYLAPWLEFEYGLTGWWTTEVYLEGVTTTRDGSGFTGWRWENRFRPLESEHAINPILYIEYERVNEASRIQKEIVGDGGIIYAPISELASEQAHELEAKLILSSTVRAWNIAENLIVEKNLSGNEGYEFGYSVGVSRQLGELAAGTNCRVCAENFVLGIEAYGGLGTSRGFDIVGGRHYIAPVLAWRMSSRSTLKASTGFGLTGDSDRMLLRLGWSYEFSPGWGRGDRGGR